MLSKRFIVAMIGAAAAAGIAVTGASAVAVVAVGHRPAMLAPAGVVWTVLHSASR